MGFRINLIVVFCLKNQSILNILVLKSHTLGSRETIRIFFDTYITFYNPGGLYGNLTVDQLKNDNYQAIARNKLIAEAFYLTGDIEKYGSGFGRIRKGIKEYPTMKMEFGEVASGFLWTVSYTKQRVSLAEDNVTEKVVEKVVEKVTDNQIKILDCIKKDPFISAKKIADQILLSSRKVQENLKKLKDLGLIARIGSDKGGYWKIIDKKY